MKNIKQLIVSLLGYALASAAGYVGHHIGVPLAWLIGPLIVSASLSLSGMQYYAPVILRRMGQLIIGCAAGLTVTSEVLSSLAYWIPLMVLTSFFSIFCAATLSPFLSHFARIDTKTSFFSLMPGGMAEMSNIGNNVGAISEPIAIIHTFRVAIIVFIIPALLVSGPDSYIAELNIDLGVMDIALVISASLVGATIANRVGVNNPWMIGALIVAAALSGSNYLHGNLPFLIFHIGQILLGYNIGSRFKREVIAKSPRVALTGIAFTVLLIFIMFIYAHILATITSLDFPTALLVASPGGTSEMTTTAQTLNLSVAIVTAFHVIRTLLVNGFAVYYWRLFENSRYYNFLNKKLFNIH
ncbi:AbrB family transcriptional regulator [Pseudomonas lopnurensis]|uniref:AbrB family transcriptional regulator n=1 Tax=Pseudomonas lopnurensis TaxID=1477517 RepID=UPI0028A7C871|nr:AbrB family transcriptional regulator [Pseudomonas lopnurensis]